jgi:hypothetical protein
MAPKELETTTTSRRWRYELRASARLSCRRLRPGLPEGRDDDATDEERRAAGAGRG